MEEEKKEAPKEAPVDVVEKKSATLEFLRKYWKKGAFVAGIAALAAGVYVYLSQENETGGNGGNGDSV